jgi:SprT-like family
LFNVVVVADDDDFSVPEELDYILSDALPFEETIEAIRSRGATNLKNELLTRIRFLDRQQFYQINFRNHWRNLRKSKGQRQPISSSKLHLFQMLFDEIPLTRCSEEARDYRTNFEASKERLVQKVFKILNTSVFNGRLNGVSCVLAQMDHYGESILDTDDQGHRTVEIKISISKNDKPCVLLDTVAHEMCHAAAWLESGYKGHGPIFRFWAEKIMHIYQFMPYIQTFGD